jgi:hypothetical protein
MSPDDIAPEFRSPPKVYRRSEPIEGVRTLRLSRHTDDRGFFLEIFRSRGGGGASAELARFFEGVPVAQANFSVVDANGHVKGLHYHLRQEDIWFFPPPVPGEGRPSRHPEKHPRPTAARRSSWPAKARSSSCGSRRESRMVTARSRTPARSSTS